MKRIIAINASPRTDWNTATLIREAAKGARAQGAEVKIIDLYKLEKFTGCLRKSRKHFPSEPRWSVIHGIENRNERISQSDQCFRKNLRI